ncbi:hypothetical protein ScPMuIL_011979 [Solemya velum]
MRTVTPPETVSQGQKYPEIKQRGYYSDIISTNAADGRLGDVLCGPMMTAQDTLWNVAKEKHTPKVTTFEADSDIFEHLERQVYGPSTEITTISVSCQLFPKCMSTSRFCSFVVL